MRRGVVWVGLAAILGCGSDGIAPDRVATPTAKPLVVRVLNVGQGDAILVENGDSRVVIDGGALSGTFGLALDSYSLNGATLDAVILTHEHFDHYQGLRELFRTSRGITIRTMFENGNAGLSSSLIELRDSISARVARRQMVLADTDDPCGSGARVCTLMLSGGARLELLPPDPSGNSPNNRSLGIKLLGPDSASFSMWLAGDAERNAIAYFDAADYDVSPGMRARILKANHHGSCNGVTRRYLDLVSPEVVVMSLADDNVFGFVHTQTLDVLRERETPWYRTDVNGTVTIRTSGVAGAGYTISVERGGASQAGLQDRVSTQVDCKTM